MIVRFKKVRRSKYVQVRTLDLHGLNWQEAEIKVDAMISKGIVEGWQELHLIHGIGSLVLRSKIHAKYSASRYVTLRVPPGNLATTILDF